jgi:hypothetical protein
VRRLTTLPAGDPTMQKDWLPFFSMLFWFVTKVTGLYMVTWGLFGLGASLGSGFSFWSLLFGVLPIVLGYFLVVTDLVLDLATAEQQRRSRG